MPSPIHRLDHLHRDQLVEPAGEIPPVQPEHGDAVGQPGLGHPPLHIGALGLGDRGGGHPAAEAGGGVDGQAAPTRAHLDQMVGGLELEFGADPVHLGLLRFGQRRTSGRSNTRARIGHGLVQHEGEEVVGEVVVISDVPLVLVPARRRPGGPGRRGRRPSPAPAGPAARAAGGCRETRPGPARSGHRCPTSRPRTRRRGRPRPSATGRHRRDGRAPSPGPGAHPGPSGRSQPPSVTSIAAPPACRPAMQHDPARQATRSGEARAGAA